MTMQLNNIIHELHRKYDGTYIFVKVGSQEVLAFVNSLVVLGEGNRATGEISLTTKEFGTLKYKIPTAQKLIFRLPKSQVYQNGNHAQFVWRKPSRQWQRGITPENTSIVNLSTIVLAGASTASIGSAAVPFTLDTVQAAFDGKVHTPQEALDMLAGGSFSSVALPGNWSLVLSPTTEEDGYVLLYKLVVVARIGRAGNILRVLNSFYEDAARNFFVG